MQRLADARLPVAGVFSPGAADRAAAGRPGPFGAGRHAGAAPEQRQAATQLFPGRPARRQPPACAPRRPRHLEDPALMLRQLEESLRYFDPTFAVSANARCRSCCRPSTWIYCMPARRRGEGWQLRPLDARSCGKRLGIRAGPEGGRSRSGCSSSCCAVMPGLRTSRRRPIAATSSCFASAPMRGLRAWPLPRQRWPERSSTR